MLLFCATFYKRKLKALKNFNVENALIFNLFSKLNHILLHLWCIQVLVGETGQFQAEFRGVPAPRPTWLVSGTEITETDKYHIEIAECTTRLSVAGTTADDANLTYTCQLTSAAGEAASSARIVIQGRILNSIYLFIQTYVNNITANSTYSDKQ